MDDHTATGTLMLGLGFLAFALAGLCTLEWLPTGFFGADDLVVIGCITVLTGLGVRERVIA